MSKIKVVIWTENVKSSTQSKYLNTYIQTFLLSADYIKQIEGCKRGMCQCRCEDAGE